MNGPKQPDAAFGPWPVAREGLRKNHKPEAALGERCEVCGSEMYGLHCKLVCPNCGYRRDCSDP